MKEYSIGLYTKNKASIKQVEQLLWSAHKLGYTLKHGDEYISFNNALEILFSTKLESMNFTDNESRFDISIIDGMLDLSTLFLHDDYFTQFKHIATPDIITLLKVFLYLTKPFLLENVRVISEFNFFSNLESNMSAEYVDPKLDNPSAKQQSKDPNAIHAHVFLSKEDALTDALDILDLAEKYEYKFIDNAQNQKLLNFEDALFELSEALYQDNPSLYLKVDNFIMKLTFNYQLVSLYPIEPFKMKVVEDETGIDIAFYLTIYLNLVKPFGINDLKTSFLNEQNIDPTEIKETISYMHRFLQGIKMCNEMAKLQGKKYEFYSHHAIPPVIKEWFQMNNITFNEKHCGNCNSCMKEYPQ